MKLATRVLAILALAAAIPGADSANAQAATRDTLRVHGLREPVEVIRDRWGIAHIYASNEHDLFFAQGYNAAHDRLFQLEIWRRQATGTVAEILGPRELKRDIGTRLFMFRGDMQRELSSYHPHGVAIVGIYDKEPAALAGLKPGDVLFTLDGKPITSQLELRNHEASLAPGTQVQLTGERYGTPFSLTATLQERPQRQTSG